jgi:Tol biopolymer transport system component
VYSLFEKSWKTYGDFCGSGVGSVVFSPDGTRVAFVSKSAYSSGNEFCFNNPIVLQILDLVTGKLTPISYQGRVEEHARLSWSPDGNYLVGQFCCSASSTYQIVVIDLASGNGKVIAEGTNPAWSPKGDWISFDDQKSRKCTIIHPDGTAAKVVQDLGREWMFLGIGSSSLMFLKGAIWSPDGNKLLFNEEGVDTGGNVTILDLPSGKHTTRSKNVLFVLGWAKRPTG